jgi:hypothetical protein
LGFQHAFLPNLSVNAQGGVQYTESYNDPLSSPSLAPYAVMSAVYTYAPGSYAQIGFTESQNATDVVAPDAQRAYYAVPAKFHGLRFHQPQIDTQAAGHSHWALATLGISTRAFTTIRRMITIVWV